MPERLHAFTALRFFAALWVVLFHLQLRTGPLDLGAWADVVIFNGAHAMGFFFVLSGALLTYGYRDLLQTRRAVLDFYLARLLRIYPAYATVHLLALCFIPTDDPLRWLYLNVLSALGLQAWFPHMIDFGINGGTWSISVELFFYALFPALLPAMAWLRQLVGLPRLLVALYVLVALPGLADHFFGRLNTHLYYTLPIHRLPEFLTGIAVGLALVEPAGRARGAWLGCVGGLAGILGFAAISVPGLWTRANLLMIPAIALFVHSVGRLEQIHAPAWRSAGARLLKYLGEASYCLFLFHLPLCLYLDSADGREMLEAWLARRSLGAFWTLFAATALVGAVLLHELVEKPARRHLSRRLAPRIPALAAATSLTPRP